MQQLREIFADAPELLAFADHAAEFYAGGGDDPGRALELAHVNVANRPTRRAIKQVHAIALNAGAAAAARYLHEARDTAVNA